MPGVIENNTIIQVALVVKDIEATKQKWAEFFGVPVPPTIDAGNYEITQTKYMGQPAPNAECKMAFFEAGSNMQMELIQPNGEKSTWQDFLDSHGEGIHHIAFKAKNMDTVLDTCEKNGYKCVQRGKYGDASGEYAYIDTEKDLKCVIEFLESY